MSRGIVGSGPHLTGCVGLGAVDTNSASAPTSDTSAEITMRSATSSPNAREETRATPSTTTHSASAFPPPSTVLFSGSSKLNTGQFLPGTARDDPLPPSIPMAAQDHMRRPRPGPLVLTWDQRNRLEGADTLNPLATARVIEDLNAVSYPEMIKTPNPDLNIAATPGKFRYDRDFLLQFMNVCKRRPVSLPPLDILGLEPGEQGTAYPSGVRQSGRRMNSMGMSSTPGLQRQNSIGLGLGGVQLLAKGGFSMGSFQAPPSRLGDSQSRFETSTPGGRTGAGIPFPPGTTGRLAPITRGVSQGNVGGTGGPREGKRTRSQRGNNRGDNMRENRSQMQPLEKSRDRPFVEDAKPKSQEVEAPILDEDNLESLFNKFTTVDFDLVSDQIIERVNKGERDQGSSTLIQIAKLIFDKARDEAAFGEMYARLCREVVDKTSPNIQDGAIRNHDGQPTAGGSLFRKYLLKLCQEDFERGWLSETATTEGKRQGLGLVRFIGELFKQQILTERIIHEYIKRLLSNAVNPTEDEVGSLCELLRAVGPNLDSAKGRKHMDVYFERIRGMTEANELDPGLQFMLQDVIDLRERWQAHSFAAQPVNFTMHDKGIYSPGERTGHNAVGGTSAARPLAKAGDLSQFGKISKSAGLSFGPTSEYLGVENVEEAIMALETLPTRHHHIFVDKMVGAALDGGNKVVVLAEKLFSAIYKQQACSAKAFERGLLPTVEMADDLSIDVPKTYEWLARLMHAAGIERAQAEELANKIFVLEEPRVQPRSLLMQEFDKIPIELLHSRQPPG
ncbi:hypothetical protein FRC07_004602 [Ceratobasidium sp. 392]|nr:hypothetical protein FRC07_004602 [Ceratobasidium sp. 392]